MVSGYKYQDGSFNKQLAPSIDGHALRDFSYAVHRLIIAAARVRRAIYYADILSREYERLMHRRQTVPQSDPLLGEPDANHASIIQRMLLREIALFDHLFDIVRNVRAQITTA
jgi:hypothetical protein